MASSGGKGTSRRRNEAGSSKTSKQNGPGDVEMTSTGRVLMDLDFVRGLIEAVDHSGIDSLEIYRAGTRIRIAKTPPPPPASVVPMAAHAHAPMPVAPAALPQAAPTPAAPTPAAAAAPVEEAPAPPPSNLIEVKSPMVGTFYRAPAPDAPPYVEVGTRVSKGQTLCILEAMKLMNELECEVDGVIREILVENAEPVEYGQVLFRIEPA
jgi:acetyl-CoA carboxylase biotin carboxyl carrier protein